MQISRHTRADEVVKMILSSYGSDEPPEKFVLVESLSDSEGKRIFEQNSYVSPLAFLWSFLAFLLVSISYTTPSNQLRYVDVFL